LNLKDIRTIKATAIPPVTSKTRALFGVMYLVVIFGMKLHRPHKTNAPKVGNNHGFMSRSPRYLLGPF
jgi:hypothetical protein